jgi:hypothetical protein
MAGNPIGCLEPLLPGGQQGVGFAAVVLVQMQHPPRSAAAGAALGIAVEGPLLFQEGQCLLQHSFGEAQARVLFRQQAHQGGGIGICLH